MELKHEDMFNQKIKGYNFISQLGQGAFARVYQAVNQRDKFQVAIKTIPLNQINKSKKLEQLVKTQINVLKNCHNENIIRYIESFTSSATVFIVIEYCNGGDLNQYLERKKRLTEDQATLFLKQILNGFKSLHEVGAMHRDFKVDNVLLHNGTCKITDLGCAKQIENASSLTATLLGTTITMAPQVIDKKPYGMEADIWSIGVVFYQMIQCKFPYVGRNQQELLSKIKSSRPDYSAINIPMSKHSIQVGFICSKLLILLLRPFPLSTPVFYLLIFLLFHLLCILSFSCKH